MKYIEISSNSSRYRIWKLKLEKIFGRKYIRIFWYFKLQVAFGTGDKQTFTLETNRKTGKVCPPKKGKFHVPTSQASKFQGALLAVSFRVSDTCWICPWNSQSSLTHADIKPVAAPVPVFFKYMEVRGQWNVERNARTCHDKLVMNNVTVLLNDNLTSRSNKNN